MKNKRSEIELSIIIVNYNSGNYLFQTVDSIYKNLKGIKFEIIVVDNNSTDESAENVLKKFPEITLIQKDFNSGFAKANNEGVKISSGKYLLILNNDTYIRENSIETLLKIIRKNPLYGIVAPLLVYEDGSPQLSYGNDLTLFSEFILKYFASTLHKFRLRAGKGRFEKNVDWITGACLLIKRDLYEKVGGFDENYFIYIEDADLGKKVRAAGYRNHITSASTIVHFKGKSTSSNFTRILPEIKKSQLYYYKKHNGRISFLFLRSYLILKFIIKIYFYSITGNKNNSEVAASVLKEIKGSRF
ncbi:MAG: glycosyltransferase family 2 protein [Acidobacteriota bacterium]